MTPTPSFAGAYALVGGASSPDSQSNLRVRDKNLTTYWRTNNDGVKASAWVSVDLGSSKPIGRISWYMGVTGMAKAFSVQISTNSSTWTTLTTGTNSPAGTWTTYTLPTARSARYVRFYFTNPAPQTATLGGIAEIVVYPPTGALSVAPTSTPTAAPTSTPAPNFAGALTITGGAASGDSQNNFRVRDRDLSTYWRTNNTGVKPNAWVYVDLGASKSIGKISWYMGVTGMAKAFSVQLSTDGSTWSTLTNGTDAPAGSWTSYTLPAAKSARYVRFYFTNPNNTPTLGGIAEIVVYPAGLAQSVAQPTSTRTSTPLPTGTPTRIPSPTVTATPTGAAVQGSPVVETTSTGVPTRTPTIEPTPTDTSTTAPTPTDTPTAAPTDKPTVAPTATDTATPETTATATEVPVDSASDPGGLGYPIAGVTPSPESDSASAAIDKDPSTFWVSAVLATPEATSAGAVLIADLGSVQPIGDVRWLEGATGLLGSMTIETSIDAQNWTPVLDPDTGQPKIWTTSNDPTIWRMFAINGNARYVRFSFENPENLPELGGLAEIEIFPPPQP